MQITVAESIGIEGRAAFYEQAGAMRDIVQNHLLQLLALMAMEPPIDFAPTPCATRRRRCCGAHRRGRRRRARAVRRGFVEGEEVPGYREEEGIDAGVDDRDVRGGEAAGRQLALGRHAVLRPDGQAAAKARDDDRGPVQARAAAAVRGDAADGLRPNVLAIHVQPDEGVSLAIGAKVPGQGMTVRTVNMDFRYGGAFRTGLPEAYERLILDAMLGDPTLFTRADEIEEQWRVVDSIRRAGPARFPTSRATTPARGDPRPRTS